MRVGRDQVERGADRLQRRVGIVKLAADVDVNSGVMQVRRFVLPRQQIADGVGRQAEFRAAVPGGDMRMGVGGHVRVEAQRHAHGFAALGGNAC